MAERRYFTSESVTEGHPDKVCDAISDSVLDACLAQDPMSRVACETAATTGLVLIMGEITSKANIDFQKIARDAIREIGYTDAKMGFDADTCSVLVALDTFTPSDPRDRLTPAEDGVTLEVALMLELVLTETLLRS